MDGILASWVGTCASFGRRHEMDAIGFVRLPMVSQPVDARDMGGSAGAALSRLSK